ncbi:MUC5B protein, partial [Polypterus senegalus]
MSIRTGSITSPSVAPLTNRSICSIFQNTTVFGECTKVVDLTPYELACFFDTNLTNSTDVACSSISKAVSLCKQAGVCVIWRPYVDGICDVQCPNGTVFNECQLYTDNYCQAGAVISGTNLGTMTSGCFCPYGTMRAEIYKEECITKCPNCKGPLGEPKMVGDTWESNCHSCKCDAVTLTEVCEPFICDVNCTEDEIHVPDPSGCCYKCETPPQQCDVIVSNVTFNTGACYGEFEVANCKGSCSSETSISLSSGTMKSTCMCCQALETEQRNVTLTCNQAKSSSQHFNYTYIKSCSCSLCSKNNKS